MSSSQIAKVDSERPPGPHRPDVQIVTETSPKSSKEGVEKSHSDETDSSLRDSKDGKDVTRQRFVLTDPIAFRYLA